jgi:hypothetical protein
MLMICIFSVALIRFWIQVVWDPITATTTITTTSNNNNQRSKYGRRLPSQSSIDESHSAVQESQNNNKIGIVVQVEDMKMMVQQSRNYQEKAQLISTIVSTSVAIVIPIILCLLSIVTQQRIKGDNERRQRLVTTKELGDKRSQQKQHILEELSSFRITITQQEENGRRWYHKLLPWSRTHDNNDDDNNDNDRNECPICLLEFTVGDGSVIPAKYCRCRNSVFHEDCILVWLLQDRRNPNKLCPCCRHPFIPLSRTKNSARNNQTRQ